MAGKISLIVIAGFLLCGFGYAAGKLETRNSMLCFKVARVVHEGDSEAVTATGMTAPFTVLVHEARPVKITLPGDIGQLGEEIFLPDPRQNSESTMIPYAYTKSP